MLDKETVENLVCPVTRQSLRLAEAPLIARLNRAIEEEKLVNHLGRLVKEPIGEGLVRLDEKILYPVRDGIPIMLADEGIPLEQVAS